MAQERFVEIARSFCDVEIATYNESESGTAHLNDVLRRDEEELNKCMFIIHWGPDVAMLLKRLKHRNVVYVGHSTGWGFKLPVNVPVLAVSRHVQSYWAIRAPSNPIYLLPNVIEDAFRSGSEPRDIDILIMRRKNSPYVLDKLMPMLESRCRVHLLEDWTDNLPNLMRSSKIFLYDSDQYFKDLGFCEGFGLPPLEAMASGCFVFSSLNGALADYLDPGVNCGQLGVHSPEYDRDNILDALTNWTPDNSLEDFALPYRREQVAKKMQTTLPAIDRFFNFNQYSKHSIRSKWSWMPFRRRLHKIRAFLIPKFLPKILAGEEP